jgi:hypothetical protein
MLVLQVIIARTRIRPNVHQELTRLSLQLLAPHIVSLYLLVTTLQLTSHLTLQTCAKRVSIVRRDQPQQRRIYVLLAPSEAFQGRAISKTVVNVRRGITVPTKLWSLSHAP